MPAPPVLPSSSLGAKGQEIIIFSTEFPSIFILSVGVDDSRQKTALAAATSCKKVLRYVMKSKRSLSGRSVNTKNNMILSTEIIPCSTTWTKLVFFS